MDIAYCKGSTSFRFRFRIKASCSASAFSRSASASRSAFASASRISMLPPPSATCRSIRFAMSPSLEIREDGLHRSCRSVSHRKSRISSSVFPGNSRVPLPTACWYRLRTFVGRSITTQSTLGQSHPSVSSMLLHSTEYLPASKSFSISARSGLFPFTSAAFIPISFSSSQNRCDVWIRGRNTTVFRSAYRSAISCAICRRYGSSALPISPAL